MYWNIVTLSFLGFKINYILWRSEEINKMFITYLRTNNAHTSFYSSPNHFCIPPPHHSKLYWDSFMSDLGCFTNKWRKVSEQTWRLYFEFPHWRWKRETKRKLRVVGHWAYSSHVAESLLLCIQAWQERERHFKCSFLLNHPAGEHFERKKQNLYLFLAWWVIFPHLWLSELFIHS